MPTHGTIELAWLAGAETFCIAKIEHQLALEEKCGAGIFEIAERLESVALASAEKRIGGRARISDVRETIRLGLIGAGKDPMTALKLVRENVDSRPTLESVLLAYHIIAATLAGVDGDTPGKKAADRAADQASGSTATTAASSDPPVTA
jgi:hypothetical protein